MEIKHFIKLTTLTLSLALYCLLLTASTQAKTTQDDFSCTDVSEIPQLECEALVDIYNSTDGPNWVQKAGWLTTTTPCSWFGMTCSSGSVTEITLHNNFNGNGLAGAIPATIKNLISLKKLDLSYNQLSSLPPEIGKLSNLGYLDLSSNQLSTLPSKIGNLTNLTELNLAYNRISIPDVDLFVPDADLLAFLDLKDTDWAITQTVPPILLAIPTGATYTLSLYWTPIAYTSDGGGMK